MAYDESNKMVVLFGGWAGSYLGDTWGWDGKKWTMVATTGPPARAGKPGMICHGK